METKKINLGRVGLVPKGAYSPDVTYGRLHVVTYKNTTYCSKQEGNTGHEPVGEDEWWSVLVDGQAAYTGAADAKKAAERANTAAENAEQINAAVDSAEQERVSAESERKTAEEQRKSQAQSYAEAERARADAEQRRVEAEGQRVEAEKRRDSAETMRAAAEETRKTDEADRITGETSRERQENSRVAAEQTRGEQESYRKIEEAKRVDAEAKRAVAENTRERMEADRANAETERDAAEKTRAAAETARADAETKRAAAETKREMDFSVKVAEVDTAVKNAKTATSEAENVDATITDANVLEVTGRDGVKKSLDLVEQAEAATIKKELAGKLDKASVVQELGEAEDKVMSQKVVSAKLSDLSTKGIINSGYFGNDFFVIKNHFFQNNGTFTHWNDVNKCTPYIPFKKGDTLKAYNSVSGGVYDNISFVDANFAYISGIKSSAKEILINQDNTPENTAYAVVNGYGNDSKIVLNSMEDGLIGTVMSNTDKIEKLQSDTSNMSLNTIIQKIHGIYMNDGTIDKNYNPVESTYHTDFIPVKEGDIITFYSRVAYGDNSSGSLIMLNGEKQYVGFYTPQNNLSAYEYTISSNVAYVVVNSLSLDAKFPLLNGKPIDIKDATQYNTANIEENGKRLASLEEEDNKYHSVYIRHGVSLSQKLEYLTVTGHSISYPIPCKSGDKFSMSAFLHSVVANAWFLNEELTPIAMYAAQMGTIVDNKVFNIPVPTVEGETVAYMIACREDSNDPDNFFELNGVAVAEFQYINDLKNKDIIPAGLSVSVGNHNTKISLESKFGNKIGDAVDIPLRTLSGGLKYNALGDSVTQASNLGGMNSTEDYANRIAKEKGYAYNMNDTNKSDRYWIKIENNKEGDIVEANDAIIPIWDDIFSQNSYKMWGKDSSGVYYRRLHQTAFGGKGAFGECSVACNDVRYYNPDVITVLIGANDAPQIDGTGNPYKLGTISDAPVGISNYYLLDKVYQRNEVASNVAAVDRKLGLRVYYRNTESSTVPLYYIGQTISDTDWNNEDNWREYYTLSFYSFYKGMIVNLLENNRSADILIMNYLRHMKDYDGTTIAKVQSAIIEIAKYYHVRYIDLTNDSGVNSVNYYAYFNEGELIDGWTDNIHPNKLGHLRMAQRMNQFLP